MLCTRFLGFLLHLLLLLVGGIAADNATSDDSTPTWSIAVALSNQIVLLSANGTRVAPAIEKFNEIHALAYDYDRNVFIVGDRVNSNDTIYTLDAAEEALPLVEDLDDDIQGIATDPVNATIYWADAQRRNINCKALEPQSSGELPQDFRTLLHFQDEQPQDIAIDSCKRMVYWTNSHTKAATIEKATLDGTNRTVLVKTDLIMPSGIAVDQLEQRLYWTDMRQGIYFRIESVDFDGNDRRILYDGTHQKPFGLAVDADYIYWTDITNDVLWRKSKFSHDGPVQIHTFEGKPRGIAARYGGFPARPDCETLAELIKNRPATKENEKARNGENASPETNKTACAPCIHGQQMANCTCECQLGYTGAQCAVEVCYNYCQNGGECGIGPVCKCPPGYTGARCEHNTCENYCLNRGECRSLANGPSCECAPGFGGQRCELVAPLSNFEVCQWVCAGHNATENIVVHDDKSFLCRCSDLTYVSLEVNNTTRSMYDFDEMMQHPFVVAMIAGNLLMLALTLGLTVYICRMKRLRPRIKKRVLVNKNITPLTYRPQVEQCEITIEDCCNMNICETPCFEPRAYPTKKDEKKTLLANMENNEEYY